MHQILIIDDDLSLTNLLSEYLQQNSYEVFVENNPVQGIERIKTLNPDLLLLDVMMPEIDGFAALTEIRKFSAVPVIMLTARGDDHDRILGLELGADDYLPKPFNHRELVARIKALTRRLLPHGILANQDSISVHGIHLNTGTQEVQVNGERVEMTSTEFMLLAQLMKNRGRLVSKDHLSREVLGRRLAVHDRSLDMHISNLRKKLTEKGVENVIKTVRGNGYLFKSDLL